MELRPTRSGAVQQRCSEMIWSRARANRGSSIYRFARPVRAFPSPSRAFRPAPGASGPPSVPPPNSPRPTASSSAVLAAVDPHPMALPGLLSVCLGDSQAMRGPPLVSPAENSRWTRHGSPCTMASSHNVADIPEKRRAKYSAGPHGEAYTHQHGTFLAFPSPGRNKAIVRLATLQHHAVSIFTSPSSLTVSWDAPEAAS